MSIPRSIQPGPTTADPVDALKTLYNSLRNWITTTATHLGQFQDVPTAYQIPTTGQALVFDGQFWRPGAAPAAGTFQCYVPIAGADNVTKEFPSPIPVALGANGFPIAILARGAAFDWWDAADPPPAGRWHLRPGSPQTVVMGTAPAGGGQIFGFLMVATA